MLRPTQSKKRRTLVRFTAPATTADSLPGTSPDAASSDPADHPVIDPAPQTTTTIPYTPSIKPRRSRGRPKLPPEIKVLKLEKTVRNLRKQVKRLKQKQVIKTNLLTMLQKENTIQNSQLSSIDGFLSELVANQAVNKRRTTNKKYSQSIKEFSITMYYYSPKAYSYLRSKFHLPSGRTIRHWLQAVECEPGFLVDLIQIVGSQCTGTRGDNLYSLVIDGMSIRKRLMASKSTNKIEGYVTIGDSQKMASEALVFLLVPILGGTRHPIGYFFIDKCDAVLQSQLIHQCLELTSEYHIKIVNITCDGCPANISTLSKLGAKVPDSPSFTHPILHHDIFVTLDPVHMLKLARNALGSMQRFESNEGIIEYRYIEDLVKLQESMGVRLANKLTTRHLKWANIKMKVRLAAQMLSSSVADALQYLSMTDDKFKDAGPTITFIRTVTIINLLQIDKVYEKSNKLHDTC